MEQDEQEIEPSSVSTLRDSKYLLQWELIGQSLQTTAPELSLSPRELEKYRDYPTIKKFLCHVLSGDHIAVAAALSSETEDVLLLKRFIQNTDSYLETSLGDCMSFLQFIVELNNILLLEIILSNILDPLKINTAGPAGECLFGYCVRVKYYQTAMTFFSVLGKEVFANWYPYYVVPFSLTKCDEKKKTILHLLAEDTSEQAAVLFRTVLGNSGLLRKLNLRTNMLMMQDNAGNTPLHIMAIHGNQACWKNVKGYQNFICRLASQIEYAGWYLGLSSSYLSPKSVTHVLSMQNYLYQTPVQLAKANQHTELFHQLNEFVALHQPQKNSALPRVYL